MKKVAIVTGAGSGIGLETARALSESGFSVYDFSRTDRKHEFLNHIHCDITKDEDVKNAVGSVIEKEGGIDLLINNAGMGISGCLEFTVPEDAMHLMNVNLYGADRVTRACLPYMRKAGEGRIVFISSVAAVFSIPFQAWYSASKAAVNSYSMALLNEVHPFGISVTTVMPGDTKTGFTAARVKAHRGDDVYEGRISASVRKMEKDETNGMSSKKAGRFIAGVAMRKKVKPMYVIGASYRALCLVDRILPKSLVERIVRMLYA